MSVSAVGSLKENLSPGTFVIVDQFIDRTFSRTKTFFDDVIKIVNLGMYEEPKGSIEKAKEKLNSEKCCGDE